MLVTLAVQASFSHDPALVDPPAVAYAATRTSAGSLDQSFACEYLKRPAMQFVKIIETFERSDALHNRRRLVVLQRKDGFFSFAEEYYYRSEYEGEVVAKGWARLPPEGIFETTEIAAAEARPTAMSSIHRATMLKKARCHE
jgi:hypothetical protein